MFMIGNENKMNQVFAIAGSILVHLILVGALFVADLGLNSGRPGTLEVFITGGTDSLVVSQSRGVKTQTDVDGAEEDQKKKVPHKDLNRQKRRDAKKDNLNPQVLIEIMTSLVLEEINSDVTRDRKKEKTAEGSDPFRKEISETGHGASHMSQGAEQEVVGLKKADVVYPVSPSSFYIGAFGGKNGTRFLEQVKPSYPQSAWRRGKEGKVVLKLIIDENGRLVHVDVVEDAGFGFDQAAVKAVRESTFLPATLNGHDIKSEVLLPVRFVLE